MKTTFLQLILVPALLAQPAAPNRPGFPANAVLADLHKRASMALNSSHGRAVSPNDLRGRIERSLALDHATLADDVAAQLYQPVPSGGPVAAVIVLEPHADRSSGAQEVLPATLARLGFLTLVLDAFPDHARFDRLHAGVVPETRMQSHIRSALAYLLSRPDVDPKRIGLIAATFPGMVAANLNPELSAVVLTHGVPDLGDEIEAEMLDSCSIVPGLLEYADPTALLSAIAPRPLLVFESRPQVLADAREAYARRGAGGMLRERGEPYESRDWRMEIYRWMRMHLMNEVSFDGSEADAPANMIRGRINPPASAPEQKVQPQQVSPELLEGLLGQQLPAPKISFVLQILPSQQVKLPTQAGIDIPVTVLRPGPGGGGYHTGIVVAFADEGRGSLGEDPFLAEALRRNWMVWLVDPRGIGELNPNADDFVFAVSTLLGENFGWRQAADVARISQFAKSPSTTHRVGVYAKGKLASLIAGYAMVISGAETPEWLVSSSGPLTAQELAALTPYAVPLGAREVFDPAELFAGMPGTAKYFGAGPLQFDWR